MDLGTEEVQEVKRKLKRVWVGILKKYEHNLRSELTVVNMGVRSKLHPDLVLESLEKCFNLLNDLDQLVRLHGGYKKDKDV